MIALCQKTCHGHVTLKVFSLRTFITFDFVKDVMKMRRIVQFSRIIKCLNFNNCFESFSPHRPKYFPPIVRSKFVCTRCLLLSQVKIPGYFPVIPDKIYKMASCKLNNKKNTNSFKTLLKPAIYKEDSDKKTHIKDF